jgi:8-oxo-dGTP pyrophosphatase MutT (NUDIX family)
MPSVSAAQHRAMEAAAHGHSTLGIPESVGKEFIAADATAAAAGIMFRTPDCRVLFLRRGADGDHAGEWCFPGGGIEAGETAEDAARREAEEETKAEMFLEGGPLQLLDRRTSHEGVDYSTFVQPITDQFLPTLNGEHSAFAWAPTSRPPEPLHPGVKAVLSKIAMDEARPRGLAFDRSSVRTYDHDVETTNISKAIVNPYIGREIPTIRPSGSSLIGSISCSAIRTNSRRPLRRSTTSRCCRGTSRSRPTITNQISSLARRARIQFSRLRTFATAWWSGRATRSTTSRAM